MNRFTAAAILVAGCLSLSGCTTRTNEPLSSTEPVVQTTLTSRENASDSEAKFDRIDFDELVAISDHIFIGEYLGDEAEGWSGDFDSVFQILSIQKAIPEWKGEQYRLIVGNDRLGPLVIGNLYMVFSIQIDSAVYPAIRRLAQAVLPLDGQMQISMDYLPDPLLELYYPFINEEGFQTDPAAAVLCSTGIDTPSPISGLLPVVKDTNDVSELIAVSDMVIRTTLETELIDVSAIYNTDRESVRVYKNKDNQQIPNRVYLPLGLKVVPEEEYIIFLYWRHPENPSDYGLVARNGAVISRADAGKWNLAIELLD